MAGGGDDLERSDRFGRIGFGLTVLGFVVLAAGVVFRGIAAHRVPWGNMYEFSITGCLAVCAAYIVLVRKYDSRWLGLFVTGFLVIVLGIAVIVLYRPLTPLVPALHSYWLMIHVSSAAVAGGAYTVGALASVLYLLRRRLERKAVEHPDLPRTGFLWRTPPRRGDRPRRLPGARVRLPAVDVRGDVRRDLGAVRVGPLLGLGPQGGLGLHHLGRVRRLPACPGDCRLAGARRRRTWRCSATRRSCSTSSASTCSGPACTRTPACSYAGM